MEQLNLDDIQFTIQMSFMHICDESQSYPVMIYCIMNRIMSWSIVSWIASCYDLSHHESYHVMIYSIMNRIMSWSIASWMASCHDPLHHESHHVMIYRRHDAIHDAIDHESHHVMIYRIMNGIMSWSIASWITSCHDLSQTWCDSWCYRSWIASCHDLLHHDKIYHIMNRIISWSIVSWIASCHDLSHHESHHFMIYCIMNRIMSWSIASHHNFRKYPTRIELEGIGEYVFPEPDFCIGVEQTFVVIICYTATVLHLSNHVTNRVPRNTLIQIKIKSKSLFIKQITKSKISDNRINITETIELFIQRT